MPRAEWESLLAAAYFDGTGEQLLLPLSPAGREQVRIWLQLVQRDDPDYDIHIRQSVLSQGFFLTTMEKLSFLTQTSCLRCPPDDGGNLFSTDIPIAVTPISAQASDAEKRAEFRRQVRSALSPSFGGAESTFGSRSLCVTVATLLAARETKKDADNLCKALLDALQGVVYDNDSAIQHLQSYRFQYDGTFSGHMVHVAGVMADVNADVLDPAKNPIFISGLPDL